MMPSDTQQSPGSDRNVLRRSFEYRSSDVDERGSKRSATPIDLEAADAEIIRALEERRSGLSSSRPTADAQRLQCLMNEQQLKIDTLERQLKHCGRNNSKPQSDSGHVTQVVTRPPENEVEPNLHAIVDSIVQKRLTSLQLHDAAVQMENRNNYTKQKNVDKVLDDVDTGSAGTEPDAYYAGQHVRSTVRAVSHRDSGVAARRRQSHHRQPRDPYDTIGSEQDDHLPLFPRKYNDASSHPCHDKRRAISSSSDEYSDRRKRRDDSEERTEMKRQSKYVGCRDDSSSSRSRNRLSRNGQLNSNQRRRRAKRDNSSSADESYSRARRRDKIERRNGASRRSERHRKRHADSSGSRNREARSHSRHRQYMKPPRYDGRSSLDEFVIAFENCAQFNRWSSNAKAAYLKNSLCGNATQLLRDSMSCTYRELLDKLERRFGTRNQQERYRTEIRCRRRRKDEPVTELAEAIRGLMMLAYPGDQSDGTNIAVARDAF